MASKMGVFVIDKMMGSGKTTAAIQLINLALFKKWIYVTPYLTEVDRIAKACHLEVQTSDPKIYEFRNQIAAGKSVVITHALFQLLTRQDAELIRSQGYNVVIDEAPGFMTPLELSSYDLDILWGHFLTGGERGSVTWTVDDYTGVFSYIKESQLYQFSNGALFTMMPIELYLAFQDVYILTYMFDAQPIRCYFDYFDIKYQYSDLCEEITVSKDLINIIDDFGDYPDQFALSKSWYLKASDEDLAQLKEHTYNYFRNKLTVWNPKLGRYQAAKSRDVLWTTFTDFRQDLAGKGYTKGFAPLNMRASNSFGDRHAVAYLVNRFMNPNVKLFFQNNGVEIDGERFALSEMLQFIWRSAIRNGELISLYIPSRRMRNLLMTWINSNLTNM